TIVIPVSQRQRPRANTGVVQRVGLQDQRLPTIRRTECVIKFAGIESVEPIPGVASTKDFWICRSCPHLWQKHEAGEHRQDCSEYHLSIVHVLICPFIFWPSVISPGRTHFCPLLFVDIAFAKP